MTVGNADDRVRQGLEEVHELLDRHRVLDTIASHDPFADRRELLEQLQRRQNLVDLQRRIGRRHPADLAAILEALSLEDRQVVWRQLQPEQAARVLMEVGESVRASLIECIDHDGLVAVLSHLDGDDLAYLADAVPEDVLAEVSHLLEAADRRWFLDSRAWPDKSVGKLMSSDVAVAREFHTIAQTIAELRSRGQLPDHTERLFVVDARNVLRGSVGLDALLAREPVTPIAAAMAAEVVSFTPEQPAAEAAQAFERYDLISAPVVDDRGKLVGRLTVDRAVDFMRQEAEQQALAIAGLRGGEDLFASVWDSARNRWPWLCLNLITAFIASRVIGAFEGTIQNLVALATLMPIVASVGGNTGNQTVALVIRGLALGHIRESHAWHLVRKELTVSLLNGITWGTVMAAVAGLLYRSGPLAVVMMAAVCLNLVIAALTGIAVPLALKRADRDPAQGSSVVLTFVTDSMGFLLVLGLATIFLI
jgi:magnesium transporter